MQVHNFFLHTIRAFVELVRLVFTFPGVKYFQLEKIARIHWRCFGYQQQQGCVNENPNVAEFVKNTQALRVCGNLPITIKGNNRGSSRKRVLTRIHLLSPKEEESTKNTYYCHYYHIQNRTVHYHTISFESLVRKPQIVVYKFTICKRSSFLSSPSKCSAAHPE